MSGNAPSRSLFEALQQDSHSRCLWLLQKLRALIFVYERFHDFNDQSASFHPLASALSPAYLTSTLQPASDAVLMLAQRVRVLRGHHRGEVSQERSARWPSRLDREPLLDSHQAAAILKVHPRTLSSSFTSAFTISTTRARILSSSGFSIVSRISHLYVANGQRCGPDAGPKGARVARPSSRRSVSGKEDPAGCAFWPSAPAQPAT